LHRNGGYGPDQGKGPVGKWNCTVPGCRFRLQFEKTFEGWGLFSINSCHSGHELTQTQTVMCASAAARVIPHEFESIGNLLSLAGIPCASTTRVFHVKAELDNFPVTWVYKDVYNKFYRNAGRWDTTGFVEMLRQRKDGQLVASVEQLQHMIDLNEEDNSIRRVFVEMPLGKKLWGTHEAGQPVCQTRALLKHRILLIDPTCNTNKFGMKLTMFVTVAADGCTRMLAYMVHWEESEADLFWGLTCFDKVFLEAPTVVFTDSGAGLLGAIDAFRSDGQPWETAEASGSRGATCVHHLLCIFHLDCNFQKHVRPLFKSDSASWKVVHDMFWRLAKDADLQWTVTSDACTSPNELWPKEALVKTHMSLRLRALIVKDGSGASKEAVLTWFDEVLIQRASMWMATATWRHFTAGAHSTARAESNQAAFKRWSSANASLVMLHEQLSRFDKQKEFTTAVANERKLFIGLSLSSVLPPFMNGIEAVLSPYALQLLRQQLNQAIAYSSAPVGEGPFALYAAKAPGSLWCVCREQCADVTPSYDGGAMCYQCKFDHGADDAHTERITSHTGCSCQYLESYGVPCRHQLHVWLTKPQVGPPVPFVSLINTRWITCTPEQYYDLLRKHGSMSQSAPGPSMAPAAALPAAGAASTRSRCFTSLMQAIDKHSYKPDHECMRFGSDDDFNVSEMMGKMIVYKWGPISWYLARVHKLAPNQGGEGHNCLLTFDLSDGKEAAVALYPSNQVQFFNTLDETATQAQYSWMPVKQVQLDASQDVAASAITSPKKRKPGGGRPPHVRWAPAVGPTSKPKAARR
jgi:hypothetical protein